MTDIVVAARDGTLKGPDGVRHRLVRGKTLADARHPAVIENPGAFRPAVVDLSVEGESSLSDASSAGVIDELRQELAEAESERDEAHAILSGIAGQLADRGIVDRDNMPTHHGWLTEAIVAAVDTAATGQSSPSGRHASRRRLVVDAGS